jgi:hypothetical protein
VITTRPFDKLRVTKEKGSSERAKAGSVKVQKSKSTKVKRAKAGSPKVRGSSCKLEPAR